MKRILDRDQRQRLVSTFIISRIDYCNVALAGLPATFVAQLQRVPNNAAQFVADNRVIRLHYVNVARASLVANKPADCTQTVHIDAICQHNKLS